MNQTLEERIASFRSMIVDYNTGTIKDKDVIKKEMQAINALNNSKFKLYFYTYKKDGNNGNNPIVNRVCGNDLHSELFLLGLEEFILDVANFQIAYTSDIGAEVSLNDELIFTKKELGLSKYLAVTVNNNDADCHYFASSYLNSYTVDNKIIDIYFMHKAIVGFYVEIKDAKELNKKKGK